MSPYNAPVSLFTLLSLIPLALAHVQLVDPYPILSPMNPAVPWDEKNYNMMVPLTWEGDNLPYPCKGYLTSTPESDRLPQKSWPAGSTQTLSFGTGGAPHLGGSCQVVLSYDNGETWQVIYSYIGGCMIESWSWSFPIPSEAPSGQAVLGWNWFNNQGNREMYQNCAVVTITDGGEGLPEGDDYPSPFVANAKFNECSTVEGTDPVFPRPGKNVRWSGKYKDGKRPALGYGITGEQCEDTGGGRAPAGANGLVQGKEVEQSTTSTSAGPSVTNTEADMSSSTGETSTRAEQAEETQPSKASAPSVSASETSGLTESTSTSTTAPAATSPSEEAISTASLSATSSATSSHGVEETSAISSDPAALSAEPTASASRSAKPGDANGHIAFPPPSGSATADDASYTPVPALSSPFASSSSPSSTPASESRGVVETATERSSSASLSTDTTSKSTLVSEQSRYIASASTAVPTASSSADVNTKTTHTSDGSISLIGSTDSTSPTPTSTSTLSPATQTSAESVPSSALSSTDRSQFSTALESASSTRAAISSSTTSASTLTSASPATCTKSVRRRSELHRRKVQGKLVKVVRKGYTER